MFAARNGKDRFSVMTAPFFKKPCKYVDIAHPEQRLGNHQD
jgi:hypothetical protein